MGACYSRSTVISTVDGLKDIEVSLGTGDIILLRDDTLDSPSAGGYMSKAGKWIRASITGFLVRDGLGSQGLALYHADHYSLEDGQFKVVALNLADELQSGRYRKAVIRRLAHPLSPDQQDLVKQFALLNVGQSLGAVKPPAATVLMMSSGGGGIQTAPTFERFRCNEFLATMLHVAGLISPSVPEGSGSEAEDGGGSQDYVAVDKKGRVLRAPTTLILSHRTTTMSSSSSSSFSVEPPSPGSPKDHHQEKRKTRRKRKDAQGEVQESEQGVIQSTSQGSESFSGTSGSPRDSEFETHNTNPITFNNQTHQQSIRRVQDNVLPTVAACG